MKISIFIRRKIHLSGKVEGDDSDEYDERNPDYEVLEQGHRQPRQHQTWRLKEKAQQLTNMFNIHGQL